MISALEAQIWSIILVIGIVAVIAIRSTRRRP
jgi:hypothetical protein